MDVIDVIVIVIHTWGFKSRKYICSCQTTDEICAYTERCSCNMSHCAIG